MAGVVLGVEGSATYLLAALRMEHSPSASTRRDDVRVVSVRPLQVVGQRVDCLALK
jgi:hypothetical protein